MIQLSTQFVHPPNSRFWTLPAGRFLEASSPVRPAVVRVALFRIMQENPMDFNDSFVLLLTCCSSHVAFRAFINRERRGPSYFPTPATIFLTFAARLRRFCPFLVSRGWIRNLAARCPEVGLDFCSAAIFGAKSSKCLTRKSRGRSRASSRIPKRTSGHLRLLTRVT